MRKACATASAWPLIRRPQQLWFTDNGRDWLGDNAPSDELNHATAQGENFGYPFCHQGDILDPQYGKYFSCADFVPPDLNLGPHVASLGMRFYTGNMFPAEYKNNIFIAEHGSWNRTQKSGYNVTRVELGPAGNVLKSEIFMGGMLQGNQFWGRPVDVLGNARRRAVGVGRLERRHLSHQLSEDVSGSAPARRRKGAAYAVLTAAAFLPLRPQPACAYDAEAGSRKPKRSVRSAMGRGGHSPTATIPSLAGQEPRYIILALYQFRAGHRKSAQMAPIAAKLSDDDLGDLAAYYAAQKPAAPKRAIDPQQAAAGRRLTLADHCTQCHGAALAGDEHIPRLAGQHFALPEAAIGRFQGGHPRRYRRQHDLGRARLSPAADIDLLAAYISSLQTP